MPTFWDNLLVPSSRLKKTFAAEAASNPRRAQIQLHRSRSLKSRNNVDTLRIYFVINDDVSPSLYVESNFKIVARGCPCPISFRAVSFGANRTKQAKLQAAGRNLNPDFHGSKHADVHSTNHLIVQPYVFKDFDFTSQFSYSPPFCL